MVKWFNQESLKIDKDSENDPKLQEKIVEQMNQITLEQQQNPRIISPESQQNPSRISPECQQNLGTILAGSQ